MNKTTLKLTSPHKNAMSAMPMVIGNKNSRAVIRGKLFQEKVLRNVCHLT
ncbi:MAG: hypothetical protein PHE58_04585 [Candidatus Omnitrophica bacterium]|nr:hypothetical protein [Candidatus Omnitrophota bacterium]